MRIILLVGPIGAGKTTFARHYAEETDGRVLSTSKLLETMRGVAHTRADKQKLGDELDEETNGAWIRDHLLTVTKAAGERSTIIVDCVRRQNQIQHMRERWGTDVIVIGIRTQVLTEHIAARCKDAEAMKDTIAALQHPNERELPMGEADIIIDNTRFVSHELLRKLRTKR